jgi:hypothetical protein
MKILVSVKDYVALSYPCLTKPTIEIVATRYVANKRSGFTLLRLRSIEKIPYRYLSIAVVGVLGG